MENRWCDDVSKALVSRSTYRLQLGPDFGFEAASAVVPLLARLGVTHVYASPIFQATPGSTHGYDATDPTRISEDLGGSGGFTLLLAALRDAGLGLIIDIVPNHLAAHPANAWWWDVLEDGPSSAFAPFFDIDWASGGDASAFTVLVPVLGDHYGRAIEAGDIHIEREGASCTVRAADRQLPLSPRTLDDIFGPAARACGSSVLAELSDGFASLPDARLTDALAGTERHEHKTTLAGELQALISASPEVGDAIDQELARISNDPDRLDALLRRQNYRLARWQTAREELDYRRFFSIESLAAVRVEDPAVFDATHALVRRLVAEGSVDGLRVDHVDGLRDPAGYLGDLRTLAGDAPVVVEKILADGEQLPAWPVQGTTGYEFLTNVNELFVAGANEAAMTDCYITFTAAEPDFATVARDGKKEVMAEELSAEVERLTAQLARICEGRRRHRDHTVRELREAVVELVASFDVYRTYVRPGHELTTADTAVLHRAHERTAAARPDIDVELLDLLVALAAGTGTDADELDFCLRLQQLTAPVMAKGVEDTAFYRYLRLISLNEVGGEPDAFGRSIARFHEAMVGAASTWPDAMLTLSTHDTKRSADVRTRISVLSEEPDAWRRAVERWKAHNDRHWSTDEPDRNAEYLLYQTLVGAWPLAVDRAVAFMEKAIREAKVHTTWTETNEEYECAVRDFVHGVLGDPISVEMIDELVEEIDLVNRGRRSSLAQMTLLLTCPGHPDLYQGTERWDLSLTDPDNRRPVDFDATRTALAAGDAVPRAAALRSPLDEASKPWLVHRLLQLRRQRPDLFDRAGYEPIDLAGPGERTELGVLAFRRDDLIVVVATRSGPDAIGGALHLPDGDWIDALDGAPVAAGTHLVRDLLGASPVAVLLAGQP